MTKHINGIELEFSKILYEIGVDEETCMHDTYRYIFDRALQFALKQQKKSKDVLTTARKSSTLQSSNQLSINLKEKPMTDTEDEQVPFPSFFLDSKTTTRSYDFPFMLETDPILTQSELQTLQFTLRILLNSFTETQKELKRACKVMYDLSDKSDPNTASYFDQLNYYRNALRTNKHFTKSLSKIQNKIKRKAKVASN